MTVKELRTLIDNLDEYIHVPGGIERLKKTVLHLAVTGQLVPQDPSEGTGEELYQQIQAEKEKLIKEGHLKRQKPSQQIKGDDIPFDIPRSWKWVRLGDVIELKSGADLVPSRYNDEGIGIPYITGASNIVNEQIIINRWTSTPNNLAEYGDLLITCKGTIGTMAFLNEEKAHIARQIMALKFSDYLDRSFVKYTISTKIGALQDAAQSIIPGIARKDMLDMVVALPSLLEQKRIVKKVEVIFALIDGLAARYKAEQIERKKLVSVTLAGLSRGDSELAFTHLTEIIRTKADASELRKTILHLAVSGQLVSQDLLEGSGEELYRQIQAEKAKLIREGILKPQKTLPPIKDSEMPFQIPQSWRWTRLGELTNYGTAEKAKPSDITGNTWVLELEDIEKDSSILLKKVDASTRNSLSDKNVFYKYDVLYGKLRPYLDKVIVADDGGVCSSEILPLRVPGGSIEPEYLRLCLKSPSFVNTVNELTYGVKMPRLGTDDGRKMPITLPPLAEQTRIVQKTTQLLDLVTELEKHLEK